MTRHSRTNRERPTSSRGPWSTLMATAQRSGGPRPGTRPRTRPGRSRQGTRSPGCRAPRSRRVLRLAAAPHIPDPRCAVGDHSPTEGVWSISSRGTTPLAPGRRRPDAAISMSPTIVYTSKATGASVGIDRWGFHVVVDGTAIFGPVGSRSLAEDLADRWRRRCPPRQSRPLRGARAPDARLRMKFGRCACRSRRSRRWSDVHRHGGRRPYDHDFDTDQSLLRYLQ